MSGEFRMLMRKKCHKIITKRQTGCQLTLKRSLIRKQTHCYSILVWRAKIVCLAIWEYCINQSISSNWIKCFLHSILQCFDKLLTLHSTETKISQNRRKPTLLIKYNNTTKSVLCNPQYLLSLCEARWKPSWMGRHFFSSFLMPCIYFGLWLLLLAGRWWQLKCGFQAWP